MTCSQSCVASNFDRIKDVVELGSGWLHKIPIYFFNLENFSIGIFDRQSLIISGHHLIDV